MASLSLWRRNRFVWRHGKDSNNWRCFTEAGCAECYVLSVQNYACAKWYEKTRMWKRICKYSWRRQELQQKYITATTYQILAITSAREAHERKYIGFKYPVWCSLSAINKTHSEKSPRVSPRPSFVKAVVVTMRPNIPSQRPIQQKRGSDCTTATHQQRSREVPLFLSCTTKWVKIYFTFVNVRAQKSTECPVISWSTWGKVQQ